MERGGKKVGLHGGSQRGREGERKRSGGKET